MAVYMFQGSQRKNLESTVTQVEKENMLLQHRINEYQRKIEQENEKRRNVENEGKLYFLTGSTFQVRLMVSFVGYFFNSINTFVFFSVL